MALDDLIPGEDIRIGCNWRNTGTGTHSFVLLIGYGYSIGGTSPMVGLFAGPETYGVVTASSRPPNPSGAAYSSSVVLTTSPAYVGLYDIGAMIANGDFTITSMADLITYPEAYLHEMWAEGEMTVSHYIDAVIESVWIERV